VISAIIAWLPLGLILDLAVWRYRHLAPWITYLEYIHGIIGLLVPFVYKGFASLIAFFVNVFTFIAWVTDPVPQIVCAVISNLLFEVTYRSLM
jgi:hypothetical protein